MSTLKVNKLRDTAGSADAITLDPNGGAVLAGVTTVSTVKVGSGVTISSDGDVFTTGITTSSTVIVGSGVTITESGIEATGVGITVANINNNQIGGRRNLIFNGAFQVAQRGTSSTSSGVQTVDRWSLAYGGTDEAPTQAQHTLSSSDDPYSEGFRYSYHITNGNQSNGAGASDYIAVLTGLEAQDLANSGWNYTSPLSDITLSFWVKSSVTKTFTVQLYTADGTSQAYNHNYTLAANTWKKVIHTFPGNANVQFDNNANKGIEIQWNMFAGTNYTSGSTVDQWVAYSGSTSTPDDTDDWYTTNDATWEITGVQLEVGSQATPFEHYVYNQDLALCQRYYWTIVTTIYGCAYGGTGMCHYSLPVEMRATGTLTYSAIRTTSGFYNYSNKQIFQVQMNDTTPYVNTPKIDAEII